MGGSSLFQAVPPSGLPHNARSLSRNGPEAYIFPLCMISHHRGPADPGSGKSSPAPRGRAGVPAGQTTVEPGLGSPTRRHHLPRDQDLFDPRGQTTVWFPIRALKWYLNRTQDLLGTSTSLFFLLRVPHSAAWEDTLSRCLVETIRPLATGPGRSMAHNSRGFTASTALFAGFPIVDICKTTAWKTPIALSPATYRTYHRPVWLWSLDDTSSGGPPLGPPTIGQCHLGCGETDSPQCQTALTDTASVEACISVINEVYFIGDTISAADGTVLYNIAIPCASLEIDQNRSAVLDLEIEIRSINRDRMERFKRGFGNLLHTNV
ncbi:hypothetical protein BSL78_02709 [Apostichopus japonicus]|uniref:Uncharacterized protein n=1 Tax=Stichopus japonicus TaxID=307972 RepID=A0A2G8LJI4_STIJA|nr:hypothetical protein BSL78_02709 [Apostichopus japonicus]